MAGYGNGCRLSNAIDFEMGIDGFRTNGRLRLARQTLLPINVNALLREQGVKE